MGSNVTAKLFHARLIRSAGLKYPVGVTQGEDGQFCQKYITEFFKQAPAAAVRQYKVRLYQVRQDNQNRASRKKPVKGEIRWNPQEAKGYSTKIMAEYADLVAAMGGWQAFSAEEKLFFAVQYARRFAYAVWAAQKLGEPLPAGFFGPQAVGGLVAAMKKYKLYNAYYWPLRLRWKWLIRKLYASDESGSKKLYWRVFLVGDLILLRRWNRL